jgi:hypothetical protein
MNLKLAELYNNVLYTVVPKDLPLEFGIYPQDQKFHTEYVFLWDNYNDLLLFDETKWKKLRVELPEEVKKDRGLTRILVSTYGVAHIPNTWKIEEQRINSLYGE